jgi:hypothetical protein
MKQEPQNHIGILVNCKDKEMKRGINWLSHTDLSRVKKDLYQTYHKRNGQGKEEHGNKYKMRWLMVIQLF